MGRRLLDLGVCIVVYKCDAASRCSSDSLSPRGPAATRMASQHNYQRVDFGYVDYFDFCTNSRRQQRDRAGRLVLAFQIAGAVIAPRAV